MTKAADLAGADDQLLRNQTFRNRLINGRMDIAQRGASLAAGSGERFGPDRWVMSSVGSTIAYARTAFALGQTDVPGEPQFFSRVTVASVAGASNVAAMLQRLEGVRTLAGRKATLSFWAKADAAKNIGINFAQFFGAGGSPSASVAFGANTVALTTEWKRYSVTVDVPSIAGKTLGSSGNDYLQAVFYFDAGTSSAASAGVGQQSGVFDFADIQFEEGSVATPFERRPFGVELSMCQRYYESLIALLLGYAVAGTSIGASFSFKQNKRASPTITLSGAANTNLGTITSGPQIDCVQLQAPVSANGGYQLYNIVAAQAEL